MTQEEKLAEILYILEKSKNPLFYFNDDPDGLCSFLLLFKYIKKGKYALVKSATLTGESNMLRKIEETKPDLIIILDEAKIEKEFLDEVQCPIIWIDHHPPQEINKSNLFYYNPRLENPEDSRSTTYWVYKMTRQNLWIAAIGSLSDWELTDITEEFSSKYPEIIPRKIKTPEKGLFETKLGHLVKIIIFLLKGTTTEVKRSINVLSKIESPEEILDQSTSRGKFLYKRAEKIDKEYNKLLENILKIKQKNGIIKFIYTTKKNSLTSLLANETLYLKPDNVIIIGREKENSAIISIRSPASINLLPILENSLQDLPDCTGGGHEHACGAVIKREYLSIFLEKLEKEIISIKENQNKYKSAE